MSVNQNNYNNIFNLLIDIRRNCSYSTLFGVPVQRIIMPKYKINKKGEITHVKRSELEVWMINSKKHDEYFELLKKWQIKQEEDSRIVSITINHDTFKFNLDEIELICEMI